MNALLLNAELSWSLAAVLLLAAVWSLWAKHRSHAQLQAYARESQALLQTMHLYGIVSMTDVAGTITEVSDSFCSISGYTREELIGQNHRLVNSGAHAQSFWTGMWRTVRSGKPWRSQVCNRAKNGSLYWVDSMVAPFYGEDGEIQRIISIRTDITASKRDEEALRWNQSLLQMMATASPLGFLVVDGSSGAILYFNQRLCDVWDIAALAQPMRQGLVHGNELFAQCLHKVVEGRALAASLLALQEPGNDQVMEVELALAGDRTLRCYSNPIRDAHGKYHGRLYIFEDITARRRAEAKEQRGMQLLQTAVEALDEGFVLFDPQDRLVFCNEKYRALYCADGLMVPGARFEDLIRASALRGNYAEANGRVEEWVAERVALHLAGSSTVIQRDTSGRTLRAVERRLADGHIVGLRMDVTALTQAVEAAEASSLAKSQFVANMSHEIRTPMNAILGMLQLLQSTALTPRQTDYASKCYVAGQSLLGLLNDVLDFSKIEAQKMTLESRPFDLDRLCQDLEALLDVDAHAKSVALRFDISPAVPRHLVGDAMRLQQILLNLGGNAIKFTAQGEVTLAVSLQQLHATAATVVFSVADTGIGIAPQNLAHIFDGFTQAESSTTRRFGGTGLGLAIARRMVALMGGELQVQSVLGAGSRFGFAITLPFTPEPTRATGVDHADAASPTRAAPALAVSGLQLPGMRILLVEDNLINQQVARELLQGQGATVQVANNGQESVDAILQAGAQAFDVVLMDLQMPVMDGMAATREIRSMPGLQLLPIIAMTANAMDSDRAACIQVGMNEHVGKPFELRHLIQVLRQQAGWATVTDASVPAIPVSVVLQQAADAADVRLLPALQRLGGDRALYTRTLGAFIVELRVLDDLLALPEYVCLHLDLARQLHTFKGLAATAGMERLVEVIRQSETLLKRTDHAGLPAALGLMRRVIAEQLPALDTLHNALLAQAQDDAGAAPAGLLPEQRLACLDGLQCLREQLKMEDYDALNTLSHIQKNFAGVMADVLEPLQEAMAQLDFEEALQECQLLIIHMNT